MRFRGGQLLITTGAPYGEGTNTQQINTQNTPLNVSGKGGQKFPRWGPNPN